MSNAIFHLQPWTPKTQEVANNLIARIQEVTPELKVLFMGAAALGLPGKNDIDLDILCDATDVRAYAKKLVSVLGEPKDIADDMSVWEFQLEGLEIDAILSDPKISHVPLQQKRFEILRDNSKLRDTYKKLKEACDGLLYSEYEKRKIAFLEEVFSSQIK